MAKVFPKATPVREGSERNGIPYADLSLIYKLKYNDPISLGKAIKLLMNFGIFEYVEPLAIQQPLAVPNDPSIANQWHLPKIKAYEAWDVTRGDTNIVVGIVDTGIEYTHNDLAGNIKFNYADPIDNADNDNDGYIDNFRGWDLVGNDGDASHDAGGGTLAHGTWTASSLAEVVDNNLQGAGAGYYTRFIPIKVSNSGGSIVAGYEGIVYAADHGCSIINASWGDTLGYTQFGQDAVNYATINKNALVIAAAGNNNNSSLFYPASLNYVISVGGSDTIDRKWQFAVGEGVGFGSNFNEFVDILAPSMVMYGCMTPNTFNKIGGGTSFAAPLVAAAAALAKNIYPSYSALQLGELIKNSADTIGNIPFNTSYEGKLGTGRLNILRALTVSGFPGFRLENGIVTDLDDNIFVSGDTIRIHGLATNYLSSGAGTIATVSSSSPYLSVINSSVNLGAVATMGTVSIGGSSLSLKVNGGVPSNTSVIIVITFTDGNYKESQAFKVLLNPSFLNMDINNLTLSIGDHAKLGYMQPFMQNGAGYTRKGSASTVYSMGLVVTDKTKNVSYSDYNDFNSFQNTVIKLPGIESDKDILGFVNDDPAGGTKLGVTVKTKALGWNKDGLKDAIILEYNVINSSGSNLDSVYVGLYSDWEIGGGQYNVAAFDTTNKIGYAFDATNTFVGTKCITGKYNVSHYAFDNSGSNSSYNLYAAGLTDAIAHAALTNGDARNVAGLPSGADVSDLVGSGPYSIANGDSIKIAFALVAGKSLNDLIVSGYLADSIYESIRSITVDTTIQVVKCKGGADGSVALSPIYGVAPFTYQWNDPLNQTSATANGLTAGSYICSVSDVLNNKTNILVNVAEPSSLLQVSLLDSTAVNGNCDGTATIDISGGVPSYSISWNDNLNQTTSAVANLCSGTYTALVTDAWGCEDSVHVVIADITASDELSKVNIKVIPNPANDQAFVFIESKDNTLLNVALFDEAGKMVNSYNYISMQNSSAHQIDLSQLSSGTYFMKVNSTQSSNYYKLIIAH
ncbi:MAG: S8 family serine peptidase [Flavobacteriales bacterium]